jgi:hypothetical protein
MSKGASRQRGSTARAARRFFGLLALLATVPALGQGKLLATGGATQIEGQAGGGLVPWAVTAGYAEAGEWGGAAAFTRVSVDDFELDVASLAVGIGNRFELSVARQTLEVQPLDLSIRQDVYAGKLRLGGDLVYGDLPQVGLGVQYKRNADFTVPAALGADSRDGVDVTLAATRLWLGALAGRNVVGNLTLRSSAANQTGLLGFGAAGDSDRDLLVEGSLGVFLTRHWVAGVEYRQKPDNLAAVREDDWVDAFVGWFPNKRVALVAAWADLGDIAGLRSQRGLYLSLQLSH